MPEKQQYMVDFTLPMEFSPEFTALIPAQRMEVNRLMAADRMVTYSLSLEGGKLWSIVNAESELDALILVSNLPLSRFMDFKILPLTFHNAVTKIQTAFSLN
jgi:muconolactone delta-isomerase